MPRPHRRRRRQMASRPRRSRTSARTWPAAPPAESPAPDPAAAASADRARRAGSPCGSASSETGAGQLGAADGLDLLSQVRDDRPQRLPVRPGVEVAQLAFDHRHRLGNLRRAAIELRGHGLLERASDRRGSRRPRRPARPPAACSGPPSPAAARRASPPRPGDRRGSPRAPGRPPRRRRRRRPPAASGSDSSPAVSPATVAATASARSRLRLATTRRPHAEPAEVTGHLHAGGAGADDARRGCRPAAVHAPPAAPPPRPPTARRPRARFRRGSGRRRAAPPAPRRAGTPPAPGEVSSAARTWPRISASPSTSDSRPAQTRNRWVAAALPHRKPVIGRGPAARLRERPRDGVVVEAAARAPVDLGAIAGGQHERLDAGAR